MVHALGIAYLQAAMSLSRPCQQQVHQLLVEIYTGFSEGFNARDLQDAKALLAELACGLVGRPLGGLAARHVTILPDSIRMQSSHRQRPALHPL